LRYETKGCGGVLGEIDSPGGVEIGGLVPDHHVATVIEKRNARLGIVINMGPNTHTPERACKCPMARGEKQGVTSEYATN